MADLTDALKGIANAGLGNSLIRIEYPTVSFECNTSGSLARTEDMQTQDLPASKTTIDITPIPVTSTMDNYPEIYGNFVHAAFYGSPTPCVSMASFQYLLKKWVTASNRGGITKGITLAGSENFSDAFCRALGSTNISNINRLDDSRIEEALFEALAEQDAVRQYYDNNYNLLNLLNINDSTNRVIVNGMIRSDGRLYWTINYGEETTGTFVELLSQLFNLSRLDAVATLANIVGMTYENLFQLSSDKHVAELRGTTSGKDVPSHIYLSALPEPACALLKETKTVLGNAGQEIGAILLYELNGQTFCLPATVGNGRLCIGKYKPTAYFLNQNLMDKYPCASILFCQDMRTALALQKQLEGLSTYSPRQIIVTAHLGTDLSVLPWNYLHGHDVVFVPAPSKQCLSMVKAYQEKCDEHARSFNVYPGFLLHSQPACNSAEVIDGLSEGEAELLNRATYLDSVERPSLLLQRVVENALPYEDFKDWGQKLGIFKKRESISTLPTAIQANPFVPEPLVLSASFERQRIENELDALITPENTTLLWGPSNVGKSYAALEIAKVLISGGAAFGLRSAGGKKVCYLDGEQDSTRTGERLHQLYGGEPLYQQQVQGAFFYKALDSSSLRVPDAPTMMAQAVVGCGSNVVIIDNLISLFPSAKQNPSKMLEFIQSLEKNGVAVIVVHHSEKTGQTFLGASELGALSKNIFKLMPVESTEEKSSEITQARPAKGPLARITLEKTKVLPCAEGKDVVAHLPIGGQWHVLQGGFVEDVPESQPETQIVTEHNKDTVSTSQIADLSPDERKVYEVLQKGTATRAEIEAAVGFKKDKTRAVLTQLLERGCVKSCGSHKGTYYELVISA